VLIRHLWQLMRVVFLHWCLICALLLKLQKITGSVYSNLAIEQQLKINLFNWVIDIEIVVYTHQGTLTKAEGSVQFTSLYQQLKPAAFSTENIFFPFVQKNYLNKEANCTEQPSSSVMIPCNREGKHALHGHSMQ
jgi:hypothetical protein